MIATCFIVGNTVKVRLAKCSLLESCFNCCYECVSQAVIFENLLVKKGISKLMLFPSTQFIL